MNEGFQFFDSENQVNNFLCSKKINFDGVLQGLIEFNRRNYVENDLHMKHEWFYNL